MLTYGGFRTTRLEGSKEGLQARVYLINKKDRLSLTRRSFFIYEQNQYSPQLL